MADQENDKAKKLEDEARINSATPHAPAERREVEQPKTPYLVNKYRREF